MTQTLLESKFAKPFLKWAGGKGHDWGTVALNAKICMIYQAYSKGLV